MFTIFYSLFVDETYPRTFKTFVEYFHDNNFAIKMTQKNSLSFFPEAHDAPTFWLLHACNIFKLCECEFVNEIPAKKLKKYVKGAKIKTKKTSF